MLGDAGAHAGLDRLSSVAENERSSLLCTLEAVLPVAGTGVVRESGVSCCGRRGPVRSLLQDGCCPRQGRSEPVQNNKVASAARSNGSEGARCHRCEDRLHNACHRQGERTHVPQLNMGCCFGSQGLLVSQVDPAAVLACPASLSVRLQGCAVVPATHV